MYILYILYYIYIYSDTTSDIPNTPQAVHSIQRHICTIQESPLVARKRVCLVQSGVFFGSDMSLGLAAPRIVTSEGTRSCSWISKMPAGKRNTFRTLKT